MRGMVGGAGGHGDPAELLDTGNNVVAEDD
jgi:hypothetical protein